MPSQGVRVEGARQLRRDLKRAGIELESLKAAHDEAARFVAARAKIAAPRRTGALASTMRGAGTKGRASVRAGYARTPYGPAIHWGWPARNIAAQPWVSDTAQRTEPHWVLIYRQAVSALLDTIEGA